MWIKTTVSMFLLLFCHEVLLSEALPISKYINQNPLTSLKFSKRIFLPNISPKPFHGQEPFSSSPPTTESTKGSLVPISKYIDCTFIGPEWLLVVWTRAHKRRKGPPACKDSMDTAYKSMRSMLRRRRERIHLTSRIITSWGSIFK